MTNVAYGLARIVFDEGTYCALVILDTDSTGWNRSIGELVAAQVPNLILDIIFDYLQQLELHNSEKQSKIFDRTVDVPPGSAIDSVLGSITYD